jgi:hypothetical protein
MAENGKQGNGGKFRYGPGKSLPNIILLREKRPKRSVEKPYGLKIGGERMLPPKPIKASIIRPGSTVFTSSFKFHKYHLLKNMPFQSSLLDE